MSAEPTSATQRPRPHWIIWLFAIVGLLGVIAFIMMTVLVSWMTRDRQPAEVVADTSAIRFVVRDAEPIRGTNLVQITIATGSQGSPYSSGRGDDQRNILLLDRTSGAIRRLLPDNSRRIARSYFLPAVAEASAGASEDVAMVREAQSDTDTRSAPPAHFALLVAQPDEGDRFDLLIGALADERQSFTMPNLAGVDGVWMHSPTRIALIVREGLTLFYRVVDIPARQVVLSRRISI